jgi:ferredoxin
MITIRKDRCDFCGTCVAVCPENCIEVREASIHIYHSECIDCDLCVEICPITVLESVNEK